MTLTEATGIRSSGAHVFGASDQHWLFAVDSGRIYEVDESVRDVLEASMEHGDEERLRLLMKGFGLPTQSFEAPAIPASVPVRAVSLAIASKCNLGCTYCYAEQGSFGSAASNMSFDVAKEAIDGLISRTARGEAIRLVFLGGEPLVNRTVLYEATRYAHAQAISAGIGISFSITTNATLLTADDAAFLDAFSFAVTISMDGVGAAHDRTRQYKGGGGTYDRVVERAQRLLSRRDRRCHVSARVSVTPTNLGLKEALGEFARLGFDSVQFAPVLSAPTSMGEMNEAQLNTMLGEMIACGELFEARLSEGQILPFANLITVLKRIHQYSRDEYPCGAGGNYVGLSAEGKFYACHRFVDDERASLGDVKSGIDAGRQEAWIKSRNVRFQEPCRRCWARHLCGGGCHYEVINRGRGACDYIRGWLHYCLAAYVRLLRLNPPRLSEVLGNAPARGP